MAEMERKYTKEIENLQEKSINESEQVKAIKQN